MTTTSDEAQHELLRLAKHRQPVVAQSLGYCWEMVIRAIGYNLLTIGELQKTLEHLKDGRSYGAEIGFEPWGNFDSHGEWQEQVQVTLLQEVEYCSFGEMIQELQRLLDACHGPERQAS